MESGSVNLRMATQHPGHACTIYKKIGPQCVYVSDGVVAPFIRVLNTVFSTILYAPYIWLTFISICDRCVLKNSGNATFMHLFWVLTECCQHNFLGAGPIQKTFIF